MNAPSAWKLEKAMAAFMAARDRMSTQSDDDTLAEMLETNATVEDLLHASIRAAMEADAMVDMAKSRLEALQLRKKRYETRRDALRGVIFTVMETLDQQKVEQSDFTVSIGKPKGAMLVSDEAAIPDEYWITERKLDRKRLTDDVLRNGIVVPGAEISNGMSTLTIRSK